jgi:hypothetical protein
MSFWATKLGATPFNKMLKGKAAVCCLLPPVCYLLTAIVAARLETIS